VSRYEFRLNNFAITSDVCNSVPMGIEISSKVFKTPITQILRFENLNIPNGKACINGFVVS